MKRRGEGRREGPVTAAGLGWLVLVAWWAEAEQLPVRTFDSREGLAGAARADEARAGA